MNKETLHEIAATNDEIKRLILSVHYRRQHCSLSKYVIFFNAFHNVIDSIPQMMWFEISTKLVIFMKYYSIKKHLTQLELPLMTCRLQLANGNNTTDIFDSLFNAMV